MSEAAITPVQRRIVLDSGPLGRLTSPNGRNPINREITLSFRTRLEAGDVFHLPEVADYEVRRELLLMGRQRGLERLDVLQAYATYLPLNTAAFRRAAEIWAEVRRRGTPTADPRELDVDVILAAESVGAVAATENVGHLSRFVDARHWRDIG